MKHEGYPEGWAKLMLMVSPDGKTVHAIGGDRAEGDPLADCPYIGLDRMKEAGMMTPNARHKPRSVASRILWRCWART